MSNEDQRDFIFPSDFMRLLQISADAVLTLGFDLMFLISLTKFSVKPWMLACD